MSKAIKFGTIYGVGIMLVGFCSCETPRALARQEMPALRRSALLAYANNQVEEALASATKALASASNRDVKAAICADLAEMHAAGNKGAAAAEWAAKAVALDPQADPERARILHDYNSYRPKVGKETKTVSVEPQPESIGTATMEPDGTIKLRLRATMPGAIGDGTLTYKTSDPRYIEILGHVGPLKPGEVKPVMPFPD